MTYAELILPEFDEEMANTRRVLERVPDDKLEWRPHPKSNTVGWVANHLAEIPGWVAGTLTQLVWDLTPPGGTPYQSPKLTSRQAMLELFDKNVAEARQALADVPEAELDQIWSLQMGGQTMMSMPRRTVIRTWVLNHTIHHRAHLLVSLRLLDVPVPGMYGPGGNE